MKYIVIQTESYSLPFIFSDISVHKDVATNLTYNYPDAKVVGAGFVSVINDKFSCWGRSVSLCITSRKEEDSAILNQMLSL